MADDWDGTLPDWYDPKKEAAILQNHFKKDPTVDQTLVRPMDRLAVGNRDLPKAERGQKSEAEIRKGQPITTGVLDYFPDAIIAVAELSRVGNDQHNPGQPLHWARGKSTDHADALARHLLDRGKLDTDGQRHSAKVAWRALALLQTEIEGERKWQNPETMLVDDTKPWPKSPLGDKRT